VKRVLNDNTGLLSDDSYFTGCIKPVPGNCEEVLITKPKSDRNTPYFIAFNNHVNG
jgi:hypothetical protein